MNLIEELKEDWNYMAGHKCNPLCPDDCRPFEADMSDYLPRILAALEAAQHIDRTYEFEDGNAQPKTACTGCWNAEYGEQRDWSEINHDDTCPWALFDAAMRGDRKEED